MRRSVTHFCTPDPHRALPAPERWAVADARSHECETGYDQGTLKRHNMLVRAVKRAAACQRALHRRNQLTATGAMIFYIFFKNDAGPRPRETVGIAASVPHSCGPSPSLTLHNMRCIDSRPACQNVNGTMAAFSFLYGVDARAAQRRSFPDQKYAAIIVSIRTYLVFWS